VVGDCGPFVSSQTCRLIGVVGRIAAPGSRATLAAGPRPALPGACGSRADCSGAGPTSPVGPASHFVDAVAGSQTAIYYRQRQCACSSLWRPPPIRRGSTRHR
jgi:hypothetical protein